MDKAPGRRSRVLRNLGGLNALAELMQTRVEAREHPRLPERDS